MLPLGNQHYHFPLCGSTNDEAARLGREGAPHGTVVTADAQERGRGRLGRVWHSPPGDSLYASVLLRPPVPPQRAPFLTLCAGVALADTVALELGRRGVCELKWPNDLLARGVGPDWGEAPPRKLSGILTEMVCAGSNLDFVVIGIGVNLNATQFPEALRDQATSLRLCTGTPVRAEPFLERLLSALGQVHDLYVIQGAPPILRRFTAHAPFLRAGRPVQVRCGAEVVVGVPTGLADDGALLVREASGDIRRIVAGEL